MKSTIKRTLSLALALIMLCSVIPAVSAYSGVADWAASAIADMDGLGLIPTTLADADFSENISRIDMCRTAMLAYTKITGKTPDLPSAHPFEDTQDTDVERAYAIGLIHGYEDDTFRPDQPIERSEFFCIITNFLKSVGYPINSDQKADLTSFSDESSLPEWCYAETQIVVGLGIVEGSDGALAWDQNASCSEALSLFYRSYKLYVGTSGFIDLDNWAKDAVLKMDQMGLIPSEIRHTSMSGSISRANMCKVIMLAYKQIKGVTYDDLETPDTNPFSDTDDRDVLNAYQLGIVSGKDDGSFFDPNEPITREDFFAVSFRFLRAIGYPHSDDPTVDLGQFHDSDEISGYAVAPIRLLIGIGVVEGSPDKYLYPTDSITCQEALAIFCRIHTYISTWIASPDGDTRPDDVKEKAAAVVEYAKRYLGYDYAYGGKDPDEGFDCSGFVYYIYKNFGYTLNPGAWNQWDSIEKEISRDRIQPGDLVFFSEDGTVSGMSHVAIYIGNGEMIHSSTPSTGVIISDLDEPYYAERYLGAKRVIG